MKILVVFVDVYEKCVHLLFGFVFVYKHFVCRAHWVSQWTQVSHMFPLYPCLTLTHKHPPLQSLSAFSLFNLSLPFLPSISLCSALSTKPTSPIKNLIRPKSAACFHPNPRVGRSVQWVACVVGGSLVVVGHLSVWLGACHRGCVVGFHSGWVVGVAEFQSRRGWV